MATFSLAYYGLTSLQIRWFATHQRRIIIYIYCFIIVAEEFSITSVLATQSKCIKQDKKTCSDGRIMLLSSCSICTNIYRYVYVDDIRMDILSNAGSYDIVWVVYTISYTKCRKCGWQPRWIKGTIVGTILNKIWNIQQSTLIAYYEKGLCCIAYVFW